MLQKMVPSIMHTSSDENPISTPPPRENSSFDRDTASTTKVMATHSRLLLEWKNRSKKVKARPSTDPSSTETTTSSSGLTKTLTALNAAPPIRLFAMPKETAKTTRPTASSSATMGSSRSTRGPLALYWLTTIKVAAGAVAAAMAPSVMATGTVTWLGMIRWRIKSDRSTNSVADRAWKMAMMVACRPMALSWVNRNSLPMAKAIKPRATSEMGFMTSTASKSTKPKPATPNRPSANGPMSNPAIR